MLPLPRVDSPEAPDVPLAAMADWAAPLPRTAPTRRLEVQRSSRRRVTDGGSGACPATPSSSKPCATAISIRSVFRDSVCLPMLNSIEPPWYVTRMPGGVTGKAREGLPMSINACYSDVGITSTRCGPGNTCGSRMSGSGKSTGSPALHRARRAFRGRRHDLVREPDAGNPHVRFDERRLETEPRRGVRHRHERKPPGTATPIAYRHRASRRLYRHRPQAAAGDSRRPPRRPALHRPRHRLPTLGRRAQRAAVAPHAQPVRLS